MRVLFFGPGWDISRRRPRQSSTDPFSLPSPFLLTISTAPSFSPAHSHPFSPYHSVTVRTHVVHTFKRMDRIETQLVIVTLEAYNSNATKNNHNLNPIWFEDNFNTLCVQCILQQPYLLHTTMHHATMHPSFCCIVK